MANEKLEPELEYKLPEESAAVKEIVEAHSAYPLPKGKTTPGKRILIPIFLILAIILLYRGINWYSQRGEQARQQQAEAVAEKSIEATAATVAPIETPAATVLAQRGNTPLAIRGVDELSVQQKVDILAARTASNTEKLDSLKNSLEQTQAAVVGLNKTIGELSSSTKDLTNNLQQFVAAQGKTQIGKKVHKKYVPRKLAYRVKAIVPGMAWLESAAGQTMAVRVGSELGGYGTVRLISPKQGMLVTSDGSVIQYGANDF